jgi:rubrerythrin
MVTKSLLDAIRVAKDNEKLASEMYASASRKIHDQIGKSIFENLSKFEEFHFEKISSLEKSLEESGKFINYEGKEFPQPPIFEITAVKDLDNKSDIMIIAQAIELEKVAEKTYADISAQIADPQGHNMFKRLSEEEYKHYLILREAYWTVTNLGRWEWKQ